MAEKKVNNKKQAVKKSTKVKKEVVAVKQEAFIPPALHSNWKPLEGAPVKVEAPVAIAEPQVTPEDDALLHFVGQLIPETPATPTPEVTANEVTVKDLAAELGIEPKSLRSRLRKSGYKKEGKTWGWSPDSPQLAEIREKFSKKAQA
jgi:hypothetical protein